MFTKLAAVDLSAAGFGCSDDSLVDFPCAIEFGEGVALGEGAWNPIKSTTFRVSAVASRSLHCPQPLPHLTSKPETHYNTCLNLLVGERDPAGPRSQEVR